MITQFINHTQYLFIIIYKGSMRDHFQHETFNNSLYC